MRERARPEKAPWTLLTNHGQVLVLIAREPNLRVRELADRVGVTERYVRAIVTDLEAAGYVSRSRLGRRNVYAVRSDQPFRHQEQAGHTVGELISIFGDDVADGPDARRSKAAG